MPVEDLLNLVTVQRRRPQEDDEVLERTEPWRKEAPTVDEYNCSVMPRLQLPF